jgi:hypothetical protein
MMIRRKIVILLIAALCTAVAVWWWFKDSHEKIVVCTKDECCCPDSVVVDKWDGVLGLDAVKPVVLSGDAKWEAINAINAAEASKLGFEEPDHVQFVIRAWYGSINPRVFKIRGSYVREKAYNWYDTGVEDFGKKLYESQPLK